jgi:hypothetical protein
MDGAEGVPMARSCSHIQYGLLDAPFGGEDAVYDFCIGVQVPQDKAMYPMLKTSEKMEEREIGGLNSVRGRCQGLTVG